MNLTRRALFRVFFITLLVMTLGAFIQTGQSASQFSPDPLPTVQVTLPPGVDWVTVRDLNVETTTIWQENGQVFAISRPLINSARDAALYQELIEGRLNSLPDEQVLTAEVTFKDSLSLAGIESLLEQYTIVSLLASGDGGSTRQVAYPPDDVPAELQTEFNQVFEALSGGTPAPGLSPDNYIAATVKSSALLLRNLAQKERVFTVDVGPVDLITNFPGGDFSSLKDVSYDYELYVGLSCEFTLLRNRINELSTNGEIPVAVRDELNEILTNSETYLNANDIASARSEMALFFETLTENSTTIVEDALEEAGIVGDCLVARKMQVAATPTLMPSASLTPTNTPTLTPTNTPTLINTPTPTNTSTNTPTFTPTVTPTQSNQFIYLSLNNAATVGSVAAQDVDILFFNGTTWSMFFDGSDVGIDTNNQDLNEFHILDADTILMTFDEPITLGTLAVDPWDVVQFDATSLGDSTAGTFSMYLDGNDVGLDTTNEYIDGLDVLSDGRVLISTTGSPSVPGVTGALDEDILAFTSTTLGDVTSGTWSIYFDGSDVGLADSGNEDIDALAVHSNGDIYLSTLVDFSVTGISGLDEDVFICIPTSLGSVTACNYSTSLYFDGSAYGLDANDVNGIDLILP